MLFRSHEIDVFVQVCREKGMRELDVFQAVLTRWGQPAHSGEPVAWLDPWTGNKVTTDYDAYGKHGIPLYTHPPAAPGKPYAYAVYFPDQPTEELVHDLDDLTEDLTNREHVITKLYAQPPAAQDAEPDMFWDADNIEIFAYDIEEIVSEYDPGQIVSIECAQRLPSFRVLVTPGEDGNSYEYLDAAIAAQGEKT